MTGFCTELIPLLTCDEDAGSSDATATSARLSSRRSSDATATTTLGCEFFAGNLLACRRYPNLAELGPKWTLDKLCEALKTEQPQSFRDFEVKVASMGAKDHQEMASLVAKSLKRNLCEFRAQFKCLKPEPLLRLRAFFITSGAASIVRVVKGQAQVWKDETLRSVLMATPPDSWQAFSAEEEERKSTFAALLASQDLLLGGDADVKDLLTALHLSMSRDSQSAPMVRVALAAQQCLVAGGEPAWKDLTSCMKDLSMLSLLLDVVKRLLAEAKKPPVDRPMKLCALLLAQKLAAIAHAISDEKHQRGGFRQEGRSPSGSIVDVVSLKHTAYQYKKDAAKDLGRFFEATGADWCPAEIAGALGWLCHGEWSNQSSGLLAGVTVVPPETITQTLLRLGSSSKRREEVLDIYQQLSELCGDPAFATWGWSSPSMIKEALGLILHENPQAFLDLLGGLSVADQFRLASVTGLESEAGQLANERILGEFDRHELVDLCAQIASVCIHGQESQVSNHLFESMATEIAEEACSEAGALRSLCETRHPSEWPMSEALIQLDTTARIHIFLMMLSDFGTQLKWGRFLKEVVTADELELAMQQYPQIRKRAEDLFRMMQHRYSTWDLAMDVGFSLLVLGINAVNLVAYCVHQHYQYLAIVSLSMLSNAVTSSFNLYRNEYRGWSIALNLATLGVSGQVTENFKCYDTGRKSGLLRQFKLGEALQLIVSLFVAAYTILISGFVPGYSHLNCTTLWFSIFTALIAVPKCTSDYGQKALLQGRVAGREGFTQRLRKATGVAALCMFQWAEVSGAMTYLVYALAMRPYGIFHFFGVKVFVLVLVSENWVDANPIYLLLNPQQPCECASLDQGKTVALLRVLFQAAAWVGIGWQVFCSHDDRKDELAVHLQTPNCMGLVVLGGVGTVLHAGCAFQQFLAGRWDGCHCHSCDLFCSLCSFFSRIFSLCLLLLLPLLFVELIIH